MDTSRNGGGGVNEPFVQYVCGGYPRQALFNSYFNILRTTCIPFTETGTNPNAHNHHLTHPNRVFPAQFTRSHLDIQVQPIEPINVPYFYVPIRPEIPSRIFTLPPSDSHRRQAFDTPSPPGSWHLPPKLCDLYHAGLSRIERTNHAYAMRVCIYMTSLRPCNMILVAWLKGSRQRTAQHALIRTGTSTRVFSRTKTAL